MSESTKAALATGLAAGYVLGRGRKAKLAMAVAAYLATKKLKAKPQDLLAAGAEKLGDSGQLSQLAEQLRGEVLTVGREALRTMADQRLGSLADALADRTKSLNQVLEAAVEEAEGPQGPQDQEEQEEEDEQKPGAEERRGEAGRQRRGTRTSEGRTRPRRARRESEGPQAPAKKAAKKAPPRKAAKKSARNAAEPSRRRR
ncbi:hypothetical protein G4Z16_23025 [Streptomyces bathyalis]|uniref:Histone protein n=1 Tax=Streptomyces bathyalis TaxID=2710756 RepID=A0A7T1T9E1_9ACTN|nr:hypothetical protein [Streptomyces bathyalis]QPP08803.1 hypothetical protein G4Z16_23025 [Streptomyces bathyalis]